MDCHEGHPEQSQKAPRLTPAVAVQHKRGMFRNNSKGLESPLHPGQQLCPVKGGLAHPPVQTDNSLSLEKGLRSLLFRPIISLHQKGLESPLHPGQQLCPAEGGLRRQAFYVNSISLLIPFSPIKAKGFHRGREASILLFSLLLPSP